MRSFADAGLAVTEDLPIVPDAVGQLYEIGLRPLFPVLLDIHDALGHDPAGRLRIKARWVRTLEDHLAPLCDAGWPERLGQGHLWHYFELTTADPA